MRILIAIPSGETPRSHLFYRYLAAMAKFPDTLLSTVHGQSPARARNNLIEEALQKECSHIFFLDDDILVQQDTLFRLFQHDKDIISGLYLERSYPHRPVVFDLVTENGCRFMNIDGLKGLQHISVAGFGCMLIKMSVFEKMEKPYVRLGEIASDEWCDDTGFCMRALKSGIQIYTDLDATVGHLVENSLWPLRTDTQWKGVFLKGTNAISQFTLRDINGDEVKIVE